MASKGHQTGMRAVYLVAAELVRRGLIVSPTARNAFGADLLVTNQSCSRAFSVQVKANGQSTSFWLVSKKAMCLSSLTHIYVFVNIGTEDKDHEYYVVPSRVVKRRTEEATAKTGSMWYSFYRVDAMKYKDAWKQFGRSRTPAR